MSSTNPATVKIVFKKADGPPIAVQVQGDYATSGKCRVAYLKQGATEFVQNCGGDLPLQGNVPTNSPPVGLDPDTAPNGLDPAQIVSVYIVGWYKPAPGGSIVKVTYRFFQKDGQWLPPGETVFSQDNVTNPPVEDDRYFNFVGV